MLTGLCNAQSGEEAYKIISYNGQQLMVPFVDGSDLKWSVADTVLTGATDENDGKMNTSKIINKLGTQAQAAYFCDTLTSLGFSDWYLPSKNELHYLYSNIDTKSLFDKNKSYWSSTEAWKSQHDSRVYTYLFQRFDEGDYFSEKPQPVNNCCVVTQGYKVKCIRPALITNTMVMRTEKINIYPNPSQNDVNLTFRNSEIKSILIYNSQGKMISDINVSLNITSLSFELAPDIYTIMVKDSDDQLFWEKLVIIR
jgi:hypothetical protein